MLKQTSTFDHARTLLARIKEAHPEIFRRFDPDFCIAVLDTIPRERPYHYVPAQIERLWSNIQKNFESNGFDAFQRATLLALINKFEERCDKGKYPSAVLERYFLSFERIIASTADPNFTHYRTINDVLLKDLGLCRQNLFPAGNGQIIESDSGFHRALLYRADFSQAAQFVRLMVTSGGHRHWYQIHTHSSELQAFTPKGRINCYLVVAEMLSRNDKVRGLWGGSWYYDPVIAGISPRLAYLRQIAQENGAFFFYSHDDDAYSGALSKSQTRQKAYKKGDYIPKVYTMIWPRKHLLSWAAAQKRDPL